MAAPPTCISRVSFLKKFHQSVVNRRQISVSQLNQIIYTSLFITTTTTMFLSLPVMWCLWGLLYLPPNDKPQTRLSPATWNPCSSSPERKALPLREPVVCLCNDRGTDRCERRSRVFRKCPVQTIQLKCLLPRPFF